MENSMMPPKSKGRLHWFSIAVEDCPDFWEHLTPAERDTHMWLMRMVARIFNRAGVAPCLPDDDAMLARYANNMQMRRWLKLKPKIMRFPLWRLENGYWYAYSLDGDYQRLNAKRERFLQKKAEVKLLEAPKNEIQTQFRGPQPIENIKADPTQDSTGQHRTYTKLVSTDETENQEKQDGPSGRARNAPTARRERSDPAWPSSLPNAEGKRICSAREFFSLPGRRIRFYDAGVNVDAEIERFCAHPMNQRHRTIEQWDQAQLAWIAQIRRTA